MELHAEGQGFNDWTVLSDLFKGFPLASQNLGSKLFFAQYQLPYLLTEVEFELESIQEFIDGFTSRMSKKVQCACQSLHLLLQVLLIFFYCLQC